MLCRVIGGASFPAPIGAVTFTWPLVAAEITDTGIDVVVRLGCLAGGLMSDSPGPRGRSHFAWADLMEVSLASRSMILRLRSGYGCRFVALRASSLRPLTTALHAHDVPIKPVSSTWRWALDLK